MNIRLHIERLVLDGLPVTSAQGPRVKAAIEAELGRLLSEGGISHELAAGAVLPSVSAPSVHAPRGVAPAQLGKQIAQSVFAGVGKR
ncbi:hypothetical protein SAMN05444159_0920 [Bradyrhizobium lablabi]|jgi:hypothetical protein|uniref:Uncharacterized protein n=1 Tax=Bradyrhizobium lablabi TaxID=722472 RepID=A0A1M6KAU5_9BRAD|nr:hypothetical protein [Bradyrhizobium lablabi]SHJ56068.1 hypothetical protein SAMN05444159_0920 [Bradyrhizobium lablabi]